MGVIYSSLLIEAHNLTGTATFTVPDGFVCVVRDADVFDGSSLGLNVYELQVGSCVVDAWSSPAGGKAVHQWRGRQVLSAGGVVGVEALSGLDVRVSGYLLTAP